MSETGGLESFGAEDVSKPSEQLSEEAKERFQAALAAIKKLRKEEKQSKKRDDQIAQVIIKFLNDENNAGFFVLISALVARNVPSVFILSILSLIDDDAKNAVDDYIAEHQLVLDETATSTALESADALPQAIKESLVRWIGRMQLVMTINATNILLHVMVDENNVDGTVLQLTSFVLREYLHANAMEIPFEQLQPITANILQTVFGPHLHEIDQQQLDQAKEEPKEN